MKKEKPTILELEKILSKPDKKILINPDGSLTVENYKQIGSVKNDSCFYYSEKDGLHFRMGRSYVWAILAGWSVADLNDEGCYEKHSKFKDLEEAIKDCIFRNK